jgi:hypothetical protein
LHKESKIQSNEFSFAFNGIDTDSSLIDFGEPVASRIEGGNLTTLVEIYFYQDFFWSTEWQAVSFKGIDNAFSVNNTYTIFDSSSSHLFIPSSIFDIFHS